MVIQISYSFLVALSIRIKKMEALFFFLRMPVSLDLVKIFSVSDRFQM